MGDKQQIYDPIRNEWFVVQPEEIVRQELIITMTQELGYPRELLAVEKNLSLLPHLQLEGLNVPDRRLDIICFGKDIHPNYSLYPLLMIECKAVALTSKVVQQVVGYNHYVKAYFVAIANEYAIKTGWYDYSINEYSFVEGLPRYDELLASICCKFV